MNDDTALDLANMVEVKIADTPQFLKVKETLTRIGIPAVKSDTDKTLYQSCHIFHKRGKYYVVHFKEMFTMDGKFSDFSEEDRQRRNRVAKLLEEWNLLTIMDQEKVKDALPLSKLKIVKHEEKAQWKLVPKYNIGKVKKTNV